MNPTTSFSIATAPNRDSKFWEPGWVTWEEMCSWVTAPSNHKECGNYLLGRLKGTTRTKASIAGRSAITLDADYATPDLPDIFEMITPYAAVIHTTYRSAPDAPRYRFIIPADREMAPGEYGVIAELLMTQLGSSHWDAGGAQAERYMFRPSAEHREWYHSWVVDGAPLPVDKLLAEAAALPVPIVPPVSRQEKRDPFGLPGTVGAFNRVYEDFQHLIDVYDLPYEPDGGDQRWRLVGATSAAGMGVVRPGLVYSHHANDPTANQVCSAFDLVRLHRFRDLDASITTSLPLNRRPSHDAMLNLALADKEVMRELLPDFTPLSEGDPDPDWQAKLRMSAKTGGVLDVVVNWDLLSEHDPVLSALWYNALSMSVETRADFPWRSDKARSLSNADRSAFGLYLERTYGLCAAPTRINAVIDAAALRRAFNPVVGYLDTLKWDGVPRVETCLPGVTPTVYTRMVARKSIVAAVARMYDPGCKWDHTLILFGSEGIGKSFWIDRMARGYSASLGPIGYKDTLITMQRSWIMTSDEGHSLKKADADQQKEFLTRTEDVFRMPYDREAIVHKRHCVIWGTTNDDVFLRRQEGNRRFLIVRCERRVDFAALTDFYVDQVWAEAVTLYRAGELLYLEDVQSTTAAEEREEFIEEDALTGVLQEFLDRLVPTEWENSSPEVRQLWLAGRDEGMVPEGTERIMETCSLQLWVEALGKKMGDHRRVDLLEINTALKRLRGWKAVPGRHRVNHYGPQLVFRREP